MGKQAAAKQKVEKAREEKLVSVVRVDLIKPLDDDWEKVGPMLRRIRWAGARCWNAAMRACYLLRDAGKDVAPATEAYRVVNEQLEREVEFNGEEARDVASEIRVAWSKNAADKYASSVKDIWRGDVSLPSAKKGFPIMVCAVGWDIVHDGRGYVLETRLGGGRVGRTRFAAVAEGGNVHARLRELVDPEHPARHGDLKINYDEKKRKWFALITIVRPKPPAPEMDAKKKLAIHRGIRVFLTWATSDGETGTLAEGGDVLAFKQQMFARRRSWYAHKRNAPARSRGRGHWRRYEQYRAIEDKEVRWTKTKLQQYAAAAVRLAMDKGCGTIVLDDWSSRQLASQVERDGKAFIAALVRTWPFAAQRDALVWAAKKAGIAVELVASAHESIRCPACGNVDARQDDGRGTFTCSAAACGIKRSVESIAAWNQLSEAGATGFAENKRKRDDVVERLRGVKKTGAARGKEGVET